VSDLLNDAKRRKETLKHMIQQLHEGKAPDAIKGQLVQLLGSVPYNDVVEVEFLIQPFVQLLNLHFERLRF